MSLEVQVTKKLDGFSLDVSFEAENGVLGILGASGSGKSLTLKCIAGIETPDSGRIVLNGRVLYDSSAKINLAPQRRRVGYLFQDYALFPQMNVTQNIGCALRISKKEKAQKVDALIRLFRLEGLEQSYPEQLSGGQRQRVALARMLACEPEIILLDEPFSALDSFLREQMQLELLRLLRGCGNAVMVTHNRDEAYRLCEGLLVVDSGAALAAGKTKELFQNPRRVAVARLTGCKNIVRAHKSGELEVSVPDWGVRLRTSEPVPDSVSHVGIRAHDFIPVYQPGDAENLIPVSLRELSEEPFELNAILTPSDGGALDSEAAIWWKYAKQLKMDIPPYLSAPPESLLLLRE